MDLTYALFSCWFTTVPPSHLLLYSLTSRSEVNMEDASCIFLSLCNPPFHKPVPAEWAGSILASVHTFIFGYPQQWPHLCSSLLTLSSFLLLLVGRRPSVLCSKHLNRLKVPRQGKLFLKNGGTMTQTRRASTPGQEVHLI